MSKFFNFFKKKEKPEEPEVRVDFKNGCYSLTKDNVAELYLPNGEMIFKAPTWNASFDEVCDGELIHINIGFSPLQKYINAYGTTIYCSGVFITDEKEVGPNLVIISDTDNTYALYSKTTKKFVSTDASGQPRWFDGIRGEYDDINGELKLVGVEATVVEEKTKGYGSFAETIFSDNIYKIDLDGNIKDVMVLRERKK